MFIEVLHQYCWLHKGKFQRDYLNSSKVKLSKDSKYLLFPSTKILMRIATKAQESTKLIDKVIKKQLCLLNHS